MRDLQEVGGTVSNRTVSNGVVDFLGVGVDADSFFLTAGLKSALGKKIQAKSSDFILNPAPKYAS